MSNLSIIISAPSGCGKSTIIKSLLEDGKTYEYVISTTTRKPRKGEIDGREYYFSDVESFKKMIDEDGFLEWAQVHQNYYGTSKKEIDRIKALGKIPIFDIDTQGAVQLRPKISDGAFIFILPPTLDELRNRLNKRGTETGEQVAVRMKNAEIEISQYRHYDFVVLNDDLQTAIDDIKSIIRSELHRKERMMSKIKTLLGDKNDS